MQYKHYIGWDKIHKLVERLAEQVKKELPETDAIFAIPRGGYIPAALLAYQLDIKITNRILPNTLVVDDICDSGKTLLPHKNKPTATLYTKKSAIVQPTLSAMTLINENQWLVFPWERKDSEMIQDYLK